MFELHYTCWFKVDGILKQEPLVSHQQLLLAENLVDKPFRFEELHKGRAINFHCLRDKTVKKIFPKMLLDKEEHHLCDMFLSHLISTFHDE